jgi:hypothetical protein
MQSPGKAIKSANRKLLRLNWNMRWKRNGMFGGFWVCSPGEEFFGTFTNQVLNPSC